MGMVMITNGGTHSAHYWAETTAGQIMDIDNQASGPLAAQAVALRDRLIAVLESAHAEVQNYERARFEAIGLAFLDGVIDPGESVDLDNIVGQVVEIAAGSPFEAHFGQPQVQAYLREVLGRHFATSIHGERAWEAQKNPEDEHAIAFFQQYDFGAAPGGDAPPAAE